jgi:hypothetical protein
MDMDEQDNLCQAHGIYAPHCGHCKEEGRRRGPSPSVLQDLVDNIHGLVMNGRLDCREKCQQIRMAIYNATGK